MSSLLIPTLQVGTSFGIHAASSIMSYWLHGNNPAELMFTNQVCLLHLSPHAPDPLFFGTQNIARINELCSQGPYFQTLIRDHLLNNPRQFIVTTTPDPTYIEEEKATESAKLEARIAALSPAERDSVFSVGVELKRRQEAPQS